MDARRDATGSAARAARRSFSPSACATGLVALLDEVAPVTGLGVLYLLAVLFVAIRRGQVAALVTAVAQRHDAQLPLHRAALPADDRRLAQRRRAGRLPDRRPGGRPARGRRARDATRGRAPGAARRARASARRDPRRRRLLAARGRRPRGGVASVGAELESAPAGAVRVGLQLRARRARRASSPCRCPAAAPGWLYGTPDAGWDRDSLERLAEALARLIDVARERERVAAAGRRRPRRPARADVAKTALLHAISHDLRSPLTAITTAAERPARTSPPGRRPRGAARRDRGRVRSPRAAGRRPARPVADRGRRGQPADRLVRPRRRRRARRGPGRRAAYGEHPIELDLPADLPLVRADAAQLERVFSNLLENAVKFSPDGAAGAGQRRRRRRQGHGPRDRPRARHPAVAGAPRSSSRSSAAATSDQGSGLGLAICRGLVEANGGEIRLQSDDRATAPRSRSRFPLVAQPAEAR